MLMHKLSETLAKKAIGHFVPLGLAKLNVDSVEDPLPR